MRLERILALTDLSHAARAGLGMAEALAARAGAKVDVGFVSQPVPGPRPKGEEALVEKVQSLLRAEEERMLAGVVEESIGEGRLGAVHTIESDCVRCGIRDLIEEVRPDLVCLAARGHSTAPDVPLGSIAEHTARTAGVPVLLARTPALPPAGTGLRMLLGIDLVEPPDATVGRVLPLLGERDELLLAHVLEMDVFYPPALGIQPALTAKEREGLLERARALLGEVRVEKGPRVETCVETGEVGATLLRLAATTGCHIVALRAHATRLHDPVRLGRHCAHVARAAPMSVLVC